MDNKKLSTENSYYFLLLDESYSSEIKEGFVRDFNDKDFSNVKITINQMLTEIEENDSTKEEDYRSYYIKYDQIMSFDEHLSTRKELARNVLNNLLDKIERNKVEEEDFLPFLEYVIHREYSLNFRSVWYCMPYLRFSDALLDENKIKLFKVFNKDNESYKANAFDFLERTNTVYDNTEYQSFIKVNKEQANTILNLMKGGAKETDDEFYLLYNIMQKIKNNDCTLVYTIY